MTRPTQHSPLDHPKADQICDLIDEGLTNTTIGQRLHLERQTVGRIRRALGIANVARQPLTLEQKWANFTRPLEGGHLEWVGERQSASGTPVIRYREQAYTAARVAFRIRHGRDPEGYTKSECGMQHCVAPDHVDDTATRDRDRRTLAVVVGRRTRVERCVAGHDLEVHGRYGSKGDRYCRECKRLKAAAARAARKAVAA